MEDKQWIVWGIDLSYFTGKLEALLRAKGIAYHRNNITMGIWGKLGRKVGVQQMPYVELPNGDFLSDTTLIQRYLDDVCEGPALSAAPGHARFISRLIEDWGDEYMWRPAMYYRWWVPESRHISARRIAEQIGADMKAPLWIKKRMIIRRQYGTYVYADGVRTAAQREATENLYLTMLGHLDDIFAKRPYLLGNRPTEADFGLFGPFFRHFFGDPVPGAIMQDHARHVLLWAARLWASKPSDFEAQPIVADVPDDLAPILKHIAGTYIPYLRANANAVAGDEKFTHYHGDGVDWKEFAKPFRLWCLSDMQDQFKALDEAEQAKVRTLLSDQAVDQLMAALPATPVPPPALPIKPKSGKAVDSWMR